MLRNVAADILLIELISGNNYLLSVDIDGDDVIVLFLLTHLLDLLRNPSLQVIVQ